MELEPLSLPLSRSSLCARAIPSGIRLSPPPLLVSIPTANVNIEARSCNDHESVTCTCFALIRRYERFFVRGGRLIVLKDYYSCVCVYIWWVNDFIFLMKFLITEHDQLYMLLFEIDAQSFDNDNVSFV